MGFDHSKFQGMQFQPRTADVPLPDLGLFFPDGEPAVFTVRGLTGAELAKSDEAVERNKKRGEIADGLMGADSSKRTESVRDFLGISGDVPGTLVKRHEMLVMGSVEPKMDQQEVVRLAENYPVEFLALIKVIVDLTALGSEPGKPKPSIETQK